MDTRTGSACRSSAVPAISAFGSMMSVNCSPSPMTAAGHATVDQIISRCLEESDTKTADLSKTRAELNHSRNGRPPTTC